MRNTSYSSKKLKITPSSGSLLKPFISGEWKSYAGTLCENELSFKLTKIYLILDILNIGEREKTSVLFLLFASFCINFGRIVMTQSSDLSNNRKLQKLIEAKMRWCLIIRTLPSPSFLMFLSRHITARYPILVSWHMSSKSVTTLVNWNSDGHFGVKRI